MEEDRGYWEQVKFIRKHLKEHLNEERYEHSISVSFTAIALAMAHGYDLKDAELAGLCHDCAKYMGKKELLTACEREHIPLQPEYIQNEEILSAIYYHTIGRPAMSLLEKIIYLADYIEVRRGSRGELDEIRRIAFSNLDKAIYMSLRATIEYVEEKGQSLCTESVEAYRYYKALQEEELQK